MIRNIALWAVFLAASLLGVVLREEHLAARGKVPMGRLRRLWFGPERRRSPRYRVNWSVRYSRAQAAPPPSEGSTRDLSQTGAGLTITEKVLPGAALNLEVPMPGKTEPLRVTALVVWSKEISGSPEAADGRRRFLVGVHFQNLSFALQQELGSLLKIPGYPLVPEQPAQAEDGGKKAGNASRYAAWKRRFWLAELALTAATFWILLSGGIAVEWGRWVTAHFSSPALQAAVYAGLLWAASLLLSFPLDWVRGFRLEHRFGLSTQTFGDWLKDYAKQAALAAGMGLLVVETLSFLFRSAPERWWIWAAAAWIAWEILLTRMGPILLIPLFYKQEPLETGSVRQRLEGLLARCGTQVQGIFSVNLSRTTRKANACLCGLGRSRRVLVSDTLLSQYPPEEIEAVLAHELGHHRLGHIGILLGVSAAAVGLSCFWVDRWARGWMPGLGISGLSDLAALPLIGFGLFLSGLLLMPVTQWLSRRLERQADRFALEQTGNPAAFIGTMRRLAEQNLAEEKPPLWVEWLLYDHPPIFRRIAMAERFGTKNG